MSTSQTSIECGLTPTANQFSCTPAVRSHAGTKTLFIITQAIDPPRIDDITEA